MQKSARPSAFNDTVVFAPAHIIKQSVNQSINHQLFLQFYSLHALAKYLQMVSALGLSAHALYDNFDPYRHKEPWFTDRKSCSCGEDFWLHESDSTQRFLTPHRERNPCVLHRKSCTFSSLSQESKIPHPRPRVKLVSGQFFFLSWPQDKFHVFGRLQQS